MRTAWTSWVAVLWFGACPCGRPDTRYVSLHGSDEAPYLTPDTAARSIQAAVDVGRAGDNVVVAPGEYHGQVLMGPGLALVGSGADVTAVWGAIEAHADCEIEGIALRQECGPEGPDYCRTAIKGPRDGGLTVSKCRISGTYEKGIQCAADTGFLLVLETEFRGIRTGLFPEAISVSRAYYALRPVVLVIDRCTFTDNAIGVVAGAHELDGAWVMRSRFLANSVALSLPGARIVQCVVDSNSIGVAFGYGSVSTRIESCLISNNTKAGISCSDTASADLVSCTITGSGSGIEVVDYVEQLKAHSCIIWANDVDVDINVVLSPWQFEAWYSDLGASPDYQYLHDESIEYGNIDADPLFVDPDAADYRLPPESPCIDTGSGRNYYADQLHTAYDLDGKRRFVYGGKAYEVDMGAYEYHINRLTPGPVAGQVTLTWSSYHRSEYSVFYTDDLITWRLADDNVLPPGYETISWTDDGSKTGIRPSLAPRRFYRVLENP